MHTSYFAKYQYNRLGNGVSVALSAPIEIETYPDLFPTWDMLNEYKRTEDEKKYVKIYREEILYKLEPHKVYQDLKNKIILCWEKPTDFCHRHLISDWLLQTLGVTVTEF